MARTYGIIILAIVLVVSIAWFAFAQMRPYADVPPKGSAIIALGDSLTQGYGSTEGNDYVSDLSKILGEPVINAGVNGNTTADALVRLEDDVLARDPKIVIVFLGGNDALTGVAVEDTRRNLSAIIDRIEARGAAVVLVGIYGGLLKDPFGDMFLGLAKEKKTVYVPDILDGILNKPELMSDSIHPNDRGYAIMASRIAPKVRQLLR